MSDVSPTRSSKGESTDDSLEEPTGVRVQHKALLTTTKASSTDEKEVEQDIPKCGSAVFNALPTSTERNASIFIEDTADNVCPNTETNYTVITMNETVSPVTNCEPDSDHTYENIQTYRSVSDYSDELNLSPETECYVYNTSKSHQNYEYMERIPCDVISVKVEDNEKRIRIKSDSDNGMSNDYIRMDLFPKRQCHAYETERDRKDHDKEIKVEAGENTNKDNEHAKVEEDNTATAELFCNVNQEELEEQVNYRKTLRAQSKRRQQRKDRRCLDNSLLAATMTKEV